MRLVLHRNRKRALAQRAIRAAAAGAAERGEGADLRGAPHRGGPELGHHEARDQAERVGAWRRHRADKGAPQQRALVVLLVDQAVRQAAKAVVDLVLHLLGHVQHVLGEQVDRRDLERRRAAVCNRPEHLLLPLPRLAFLPDGLIALVFVLGPEAANVPEVRPPR